MMLWHPSDISLSRMLDGMYDSKTQTVLEKHLRLCRNCQTKREALDQVKTRLQGLPALEETFGRESPVPQLLPSPVVSQMFLRRGIGIGILAGLGCVITGLIVLRSPPLTLRVISSDPQLISSEGILRPPLQSDAALRTLSNLIAGHVDLEIPGQLRLRLKSGTTITWQQVSPPWFHRRPHIVVNLMRGELIARTQESFWGSRLEIRTPTAMTMIKGTAFALKVNPTEDATTVKVLAGSVFFSPYLAKVGVNVQAGQMSRIESARLPNYPESMSPSERKALLEVYRIGYDPSAALVIGDGPERVKELLNTALLYLSPRGHPSIHDFIRKSVDELNNAILENDPIQEHEEAIKALEMALNFLTEQEFIVPLRLFVGACAAQLEDPIRARDHFYHVVDKFPQNPMASVALAAVALISEKQLNNLDAAHEAYKILLARYPKSPEAVLAREFLKKNPRFRR